ncbi:MAG: N-formylglutamate amidohydrolase [Phycisphaerales bacterium]|nr:MAG: N-formylglutamate amidohydrolase [Phycisphaerales bacterium]
MMTSNPWRPDAIVLSCEHAGRDVPPEYRPRFRGAGETLRSHRGWDPGSLGIALQLAANLGAPLHVTTATRLLVDPNRSEDQPDLFSEFTRGLGECDRAEILARYHTPHRAGVERTIRAHTDAGRRVLHVGVHTCVDELHNQRRELDCAFLFDPARAHEHELCARWRDALLAAHPAIRAPFNRPYLGTDDGLTTALRARLPAPLYAGIELEARQGYVRSRAAQRGLADRLTAALLDATRFELSSPEPGP